MRDESVQHLGVALVARPVARRCTVPVERIHIGPLSQEVLHLNGGGGGGGGGSGGGVSGVIQIVIRAGVGSSKPG